MDQPVLALASLPLAAPLAAAQSSSAGLVGLVRDTSGAALPGVTVEVSSPALIDRLKTTVTTETGSYQVVDLRPGEYTVTFSLPGFQTVRQSQVALSAAFTATVNATLPVGRIEEQVVVQGGSPVTDVRSAPPSARCTRSSSRGSPSDASPTSR